MRAYKRPDGQYDVYDVEPKVISEEEYNEINRKQDLEDRKAKLLAEIAEIDKALAASPAEVAVEAVQEEKEEIPQEQPTVIRKSW